MLAALACALTWAAIAKVGMITRTEARAVPAGREQVIASLKGGILRELKVREGEAVSAGQPLALLDPTRVETWQNEGRLKRLALLATVVRLKAEANGRPLRFPTELDSVSQVVQGGTGRSTAAAAPSPSAGQSPRPGRAGFRRSSPAPVRRGRLGHELSAGQRTVMIPAIIHAIALAPAYSNRRHAVENEDGCMTPWSRRSQNLTSGLSWKNQAREQGDCDFEG